MVMELWGIPGNIVADNNDNNKSGDVSYNNNNNVIVNIDRDEGWEEIYVAMHAHNQGEELDFFEVVILMTMTTTPTMTTPMIMINMKKCCRQRQCNNYDNYDDAINC